MENEKKIKVVLLEPGKLARATEIDASLAGMQKTVGGLIEPFYPFEEQVCIVCNEESRRRDGGFHLRPRLCLRLPRRKSGQSFRRADRPLRQDVPLS